ncbi:MAG: ATP-binding cassette domain-containing protein [Promethearchaeia archaeon]
MDNNYAIKVENLSADFGTFQIKNVDFQIREKEYFMLLGPTGAGKTLILELIAGFHKPDEGKILIHQKDMEGIPASKRNIGFVYQDYSLFPHMNAEENIKFGLDMQKMEKKVKEEKTNRIVEKLKIGHLLDRNPLTLSGGEQQKIALGRALVLDPPILLLDEPFSALDPVSKKEAMKVVQKIHKDHELTILEVTHNQDDAMLGDRLSLIMDGEIVDTGTPEKIFNAPNSTRAARFVGIENIVEGEVLSNQNRYTEIKTEHFKVWGLSEYQTGKVKVFIRPENIILSKQKFKSSLRNHIKSTVSEVLVVSKELIQITLTNGLKAYITHNAKTDLEIQEGDKIYASFKATAVSIKKQL